MLDWPNGPRIKDIDTRFSLSLVPFELLWRVMETEAGYLGMVPKGAKVGDEICIFNSFDAPAVLRETSENCHNFVGNSFVVGLMDGEATTFTKSGRTAPRLFELR